jgi:hypothetical protein
VSRRGRQDAGRSQSQRVAPERRLRRRSTSEHPVTRNQRPPLANERVDGSSLLAAIPQKPQDEVQLGLAWQRLDRAHDRLLAADLDPIPDFERLIAAEVAGRDQLAAAAAS